MAIKEYKTPAELIANLEENKGLAKGTASSALFLEKTYQDLFSPYFDFVAVGRDLVSGKRVYPESTDYSTFHQLSLIDEGIELKLHLLIGAFEKRIRSFVICCFCESLKVAGDPSCTQSFDLANSTSGIYCFCGTADFSLWQNSYQSKTKTLPPKEAQRVIAEEQAFLKEKREHALNELHESYGLSSSRSTPMTKHYMAKYSTIPAFVGMHSLSFGTTAMLFGMLPKDKQQEFWQVYCSRPGHQYSDIDLCAFLRRLKRVVDLRNVINHYEPIFPTICSTNKPSINSFFSILERLRQNYSHSLTTLPVSLPIAPLTVSRSAYNADMFDAVSYTITILNK
jgi:hypothetical protein